MERSENLAQYHRFHRLDQIFMTSHNPNVLTTNFVNNRFFSVFVNPTLVYATLDFSLFTHNTRLHGGLSPLPLIGYSCVVSNR